MRFASLFLAAPLLLAAGCADYRWTSGVPEEKRTVAVTVFENRTVLAELGPEVTRCALREFQREGTFAIRRSGESSIEVQGVVKKASFGPIAYDRGHGMRAGEYRCFATAEVTVIDKDGGKVLLQGREYTSETTVSAHGDLLTAKRDSVMRLAAELARQIVDDVLNYPYAGANRPSGAGGNAR